MASRDNRWWMDHQLWVELFAISNIGFMAVDIYLAHSVNQFRKTAEYIPLFFSLAAPVLLLIALSQRTRNPGIWRLFGFIVGWASILVGLAGVLFLIQIRWANAAAWSDLWTALQMRLGNAIPTSSRRPV